MIRKTVAAIESITQVTPSVREFTCRIPSEAKLTFRPGQYAMVSSAIDGDPVPKLRAYFYASPDEENEYVSFIVNQTPDMPEDARIRRKIPAGPKLYNAREGEAVTFWGPFGDLLLPAKPIGHLLMAAEGVGIAPFLCFLRETRLYAPDQKMLLFWECDKEEQLGHLQELENYDGMYPFHVKASLRKPGPEWKGAKGPVVELAKKRLQNFGGIEAFIVGSPRFVEGFRTWLRESGMPAEHIRAEYLPAVEE